MQREFLELKNNIENLINTQPEFRHITEFEEIAERLIALNESESERLRKETDEIIAKNKRLREANNVTVTTEESIINNDQPLTAQQVYQLFQNNQGQQIINKLSPSTTTVTDNQKILKIANDPELWQQHLVRISEQLS